MRPRHLLRTLVVGALLLLFAGLWFADHRPTATEALAQGAGVTVQAFIDAVNQVLRQVAEFEREIVGAAHTLTTLQGNFNLAANAVVALLDANAPERLALLAKISELDALVQAMMRFDQLRALVANIESDSVSRLQALTQQIVDFGLDHILPQQDFDDFLNESHQNLTNLVAEPRSLIDQFQVLMAEINAIMDDVCLKLTCT